jgi:hypothetical protein
MTKGFKWLLKRAILPLEMTKEWFPLTGADRKIKDDDDDAEDGTAAQDTL